MSEAKYTPGPWAWIRDTDGYHLVTAHSGQRVVLTSAINNSLGDWDAPGTSCLFAREGDPSQLVPLTPDHPDARLIAAAPELLAACELALAFVLSQRMGSGNVEPELLRVIAKAKGEQA